MASFAISTGDATFFLSTRLVIISRLSHGSGIDMAEANVTITAKSRTTTRCKGKIRAMREGGTVLGVLYGRKVAATPIEFDVKALPAQGHTRSSVMTLSLDGKNHQVLMREVQVHPLRDTVLHADFQEVAPDDVVNIRIPVNFVGLTREQEKDGSFRVHVRSIPVRCRVKDAPKSVEVNVGHLKIEDSSYLGDIDLGEAVRIIGQKNMALATLAKM